MSHWVCLLLIVQFLSSGNWETYLTVQLNTKIQTLIFVLGTVKIISDEALTDDKDSFEPGIFI